MYFFFFFLGDLKHFSFPFEYIIYLTRSRTMDRKPHLTLIFHQLVEKPHLERRERPTGEARRSSRESRRWNVCASTRLFHGSVGHSTSPRPTPSQPETLKRHKTTFLSQNLKHLASAMIAGNIKKRENILSVY